MKHHLGLWKTTVLGGVFFLLPIGVLIFLIGQAVNVIFLVARPLQPYTKGWSIGGLSLGVLLATLMVVVACYAAGVVARRSFATKYTEQIEKLLMLLFPRYALIKDRLAGNLGGDLARPHLKPVLVRFEEYARIGFEVERTPCASEPSEKEQVQHEAADRRTADASEQETVTVYLPGAPDPWTGHVIHIAADRVTALSTDFAETVDICETLGRRAGAAIS